MGKTSFKDLQVWKEIDIDDKDMQILSSSLTNRDWKTSMLVIDQNLYKLKRRPDKNDGLFRTTDALMTLKLLLIDYLKSIYNDEELEEFITKYK